MIYTWYWLLIYFSEPSCLIGESIIINLKRHQKFQSNIGIVIHHNRNSRHFYILLIKSIIFISKLFTHHKNFLLLLYYSSRSLGLLDTSLLIFVDVPIKSSNKNNCYCWNLVNCSHFLQTLRTIFSVVCGLLFLLSVSWASTSTKQPSELFQYFSYDLQHNFIQSPSNNNINLTVSQYLGFSQQFLNSTIIVIIKIIFK